jgi:hypothetical protein
MMSAFPRKHAHSVPATSLARVRLRTFYGAYVAPSTNKVRGASSSRPLCGLASEILYLLKRPSFLASRGFA